ncbi:MAG: leucine--tRNA ligase [Candidatus Aenigmatarchaeota archaeon]
MNWYEKGVFEAEPSNNKKFYMLFAYPTTSGILHIGHARSYTIPDVIARYKRLRGFNVLFPLGFHATGIDCIKIFDKIKENLENAKIYGIPIEDAKKIFSPEELEKYFEKRMEESMKKLGISLDFREKVSTIDPQYKKFIQWQFKKLKEKGYLIQRDYRLAWCPKCNNPVSLDPAEADISEWKGAQIKEYFIIKFKIENEDVYLPAATMRPETIFGVTNIWINPNGKYVKAKVDNEIWVVSNDAIKKLENLDKKIEIIKEISKNDILGKNVINPITKNKVQILEGEFVDISEATGVVMSVPAHDPFDYIYLKKKAPNIKTIQVIEVLGFGKEPAGEILRKMNIKDEKDPKIEEAVKELYKLEFQGKMLNSIEKFGGMLVSEAKEKIVKYIDSIGAGDRIYEFSVKPIHCRCGTEIIIKKVSNQWFIDYGNKQWKEITKKAIEKMNFYPEEYKKELPGIIDWLEARPCVRKRGFGTDFPFEKDWKIEALSDSTIYMAFFIISKYINNGEIKIDDLTDEFFDYVFLNKKIKIKNKIYEKIKKEFEYWYPLDLNAGGKEHKAVHFPFFIFHHTAIFPEKYWPKGIFLNWHLIVEGKKMSKHLGNVIYIDDAIKDFGADAVRLYVINGCNQWQDFDWSNKIAENYKKIISEFKEIFLELIKSESKEIKRIDKWFASRFNHNLELATALLEKNEIKKASDILFFNVLSDIKWYKNRTKNYNIKNILLNWLKSISIFIPFTAEELWNATGNTGFISNESWPKIDSNAINLKIEAEEEVVKKIIEDINEIKKITNIEKPQKISIIVSEKWKYEVYNYVVQGKDIKDIMSDEKYKKIGKRVIDYILKLKKKFIKDELFLSETSEFSAICDAKEFLENIFKCDIEIYRANKIPNDAAEEIKKKALSAEPGKPGIILY